MPSRRLHTLTSHPFHAGLQSRALASILPEDRSSGGGLFTFHLTQARFEVQDLVEAMKHGLKTGSIQFHAEPIPSPNKYFI